MDKNNQVKKKSHKSFLKSALSAPNKAALSNLGARSHYGAFERGRDQWRCSVSIKYTARFEDLAGKENVKYNFKVAHMFQ